MLRKMIPIPTTVALLLCCASLFNCQRRDVIPGSCPTVSCPVDCERSEDGRGCVECDCPAGQRCPVVVCPQQRDCRRLQQMDGCQTCVCELPTYSILDANNNIETFILDRPIPGSVERCRVADLRVINQCTSGLFGYREALRLRNPAISNPIYPWFKYERNQLEEFCNVMSQLPDCIGTDRMARCKEQHSGLSYLLSMFSYPCFENRQQFFDFFDCTFNMMAAHGKMRLCQSGVMMEMGIAARGHFSLAQKQKLKCEALNDLLDCTRPPLKLHCGGEASMVFHESLVKGRDFIAPECVTDVRGFFIPNTDVLRQSAVGVNADGKAKNSDTLAVIRQGTERVVQNDRIPVPKSLSSTSPSKCERVPMRLRCPDGSRPQRVNRWYRPGGSSECNPYQYGYCGREVEAEEEPLRYEDECYDTCFSRDEMQQLLVFMKFRDGFRVDDDT